jgi:cysteine-rich repeat protein
MSALPHSRTLGHAALAVLALCACARDDRSAAGSVDLVAEIDQCPSIIEVSALPLEVVVGGKIEVRAQTNFEPERHGWRATVGYFADPNAEATTYFCGPPGKQTLSFEISDGDICNDNAELQVTCSGSRTCGDGHLDHGEQCDDGNRNAQDGCSAQCGLEVE